MNRIMVLVLIAVFSMFDCIYEIIKQTMTHKNIRHILMTRCPNITNILQKSDSFSYSKKDTSAGFDKSNKNREIRDVYLEKINRGIEYVIKNMIINLHEAFLVTCIVIYANTENFRFINGNQKLKSILVGFFNLDLKKDTLGKKIMKAIEEITLLYMLLLYTVLNEYKHAWNMLIGKKIKSEGMRYICSVLFVTPVLMFYKWKLEILFGKYSAIVGFIIYWCFTYFGSYIMLMVELYVYPENFAYIDKEKIISRIENNSGYQKTGIYVYKYMGKENRYKDGVVSFFFRSYIIISDEILSQLVRFEKEIESYENIENSNEFVKEFYKMKRKGIMNVLGKEADIEEMYLENILIEKLIEYNFKGRVISEFLYFVSGLSKGIGFILFCGLVEKLNLVPHKVSHIFYSLFLEEMFEITISKYIGIPFNILNLIYKKSVYSSICVLKRGSKIGKYMLIEYFSGCEHPFSTFGNIVLYTGKPSRFDSIDRLLLY